MARTVSSFNNRVLVASLFLPTTTASTIHAVHANAHDSRLSDTNHITNPPLKPIKEGAPGTSPTSPRSPGFNISPPVKHRPVIPQSIVDDLTSKQSKPPTSPIHERFNAFGTFVNVSTETKAQIPPPAHAQRIHMEVPESPFSDGTLTPPTPSQSMHRRLSRKQSRPSMITSDTPHTPWEVEPNPSANGSLHNAVDSVDHLYKRGKRWIGVSGPSTDDIASDAREEITKTLLVQASSVPVWISDAEFSGGYDIYCHQVLWPTLHSILPDRPKNTSRFESSSVAQYKAINERFAEKIVEVYEPGDIRVNDYHLLLLPQLLRTKLPHATIGFFLHVAFPSSEIFRCLAERENLLRGMLGADLIGFQTQSFARHFRQCVFRVLGLEATPKAIVFENGIVHVSAFPIGIDVQGLTVKRRDPAVAEWVKSLRERYPGVKMIVARDKLDEVQGVRQKFLAFERFLEENPEFHGNVMLIQVALSTSETNELQGSVVDVVSRINSKFSTLTYQPIIFFYTHDLTFPQYLALLTVADTFIVTSLREGMALRTHEFVECQEERKRPLILSEFTGSYTSGFKSCIPINPWDTRQTAEAIRQALCMSDEEAATRWKALHAHVNNQTAQKFVTDFITRCLRVNYKHHIRDTLVIPELDPVVIKDKYQAASRRLMLIDLEKTMWKVEPRPFQKQVFEVPTEAVELLKKLAVGNEVWVLSGLPVEGRLEIIARGIPSIGICAEHGCFVKPPGQSQWVSLIEGFSLDWMDACMDILNYFTERTPGSFIEKRQATIVWRFWTGDSNNPDDEAWARRQAAEAQNHIFDTFAEHLRIVPSANSFFITPRIMGRATAVNAILDPSLLNCNSPKDPSKGSAADDEVHAGRFDLILTIGSDESLIHRMKRLPNAETIYTGSRRSGASWKLEPANLYAVLEQMIGTTGDEAHLHTRTLGIFA